MWKNKTLSHMSATLRTKKSQTESCSCSNSQVFLCVCLFSEFFTERKKRQKKQPEKFPNLAVNNNDVVFSSRRDSWYVYSSGPSSPMEAFRTGGERSTCCIQRLQKILESRGLSWRRCKAMVRGPHKGSRFKFNLKEKFKMIKRIVSQEKKNIFLLHQITKFFRIFSNLCFFLVNYWIILILQIIEMKQGTKITWIARRHSFVLIGHKPKRLKPLWMRGVKKGGG